MRKQIIDLSTKTPEEIYDFLQVLLFVRQKLNKNGYVVHVKKSRSKKRNKLSK